MGYHYTQVVFRFGLEMHEISEMRRFHRFHLTISGPDSLQIAFFKNCKEMQVKSVNFTMKYVHFNVKSTHFRVKSMHFTSESLHFTHFNQNLQFEAQTYHQVKSFD